MKVKYLIKEEESKIIRDRDGKVRGFLVKLLLILSLISLAFNLIKTRIYLRKCNKLGKVVLTWGKPVIINRGMIRMGNLVRIISKINRVLIDIDRGGILQIGDNCRINGANISVTTRVIIGNNCRIAPHTIIMDGDHHDVSDRMKEGKTNEIIIEDDVWLATRTMVLKGVTIGKGAVVASGAVVTKNVRPYTVVAGVPAKEIRDIQKSQ